MPGKDMSPPPPHQWGTTLESSSLRPKLGGSGLSFTSHKTEGISRGKFWLERRRHSMREENMTSHFLWLPAWPCPHLLGVKNPRLENRGSTCPGPPLWEDASSSSPAGAPPPLLQSPGCWVARPLLLETAGSTPKTRFTRKIADP